MSVRVPSGDEGTKSLLKFGEKELNSQRLQGIGDGLMLGLTRPFPWYVEDPAARELRSSRLAVPSGVVNLTDGSIEPHDPAVHDTVAVTAGDYRPGDVDAL